MGNASNRNGGVDIKDSDVHVGGDMAGRDIIKTIQEAPQPPDEVGREQEIADLMKSIEQGGALITGLRGMGGIGKTALALVVANRLKDRYPDAQFFLDLRGVSDKPLSPYEEMAHVVRAYYPTSKLPDTFDEMQALYRSELNGERALLLMDNAQDANQIRPLLPPASCLSLITSRNTFTLPGLKVKDLNLLPPDDARRLLIEIADRLNGVILSRDLSTVILSEAKNLRPREQEILRALSGAQNDAVMVVDALAYLCGYLPQALRASASLIANTIDLDPCDYVTQLRDERQRLQRIGIDPDRNLDVEASLNLSYARLPADTQRVFTQLSAFPADFDAKAEEVVCEDESHAHLSKLVQLSLVQYTPTPTLPRSRPSTALRSAQDARTGEGAALHPSPVGAVPTGEGLGWGQVVTPSMTSCACSPRSARPTPTAPPRSNATLNITRMC